MEASSVGTLQNKLSSPLDKGKRILLGLDIDFFDFNPRLGRFGLATVIDATYSARHTPRAAEGRAGFNTRPPRTRAWLLATGTGQSQAISGVASASPHPIGAQRAGAAGFRSAQSGGAAHQRRAQLIFLNAACATAPVSSDTPADRCVPGACAGIRQPGTLPHFRNDP
jgi:hypothetical protein